MHIPAVVDAFVARVNACKRELEPPQNVPPELREGHPRDDVSDDDWTCWNIRPFDHARRIQELEKRLGLPFPPSFHNFISRYSFPAFEFGPVMFFANTGQDLFWELEKRLFLDRIMSPELLQAGYLQIGNPFFYNYDPVCIDTRSPGVEGRIVQLDHEQILCFNQLQIVEEIASSFVELMERSIATGGNDN
jgi:hypothetical protein